MLNDSQGLKITTHSSAAIAAVDRFIDASLRYGNVSVILKAIAADPTCAIAHAYAAAHYLSQESFKGHRLALPHLKAAKQYQQFATEREQAYIAAIDAWAQGDIVQAISQHEFIAEQFPQDLISVQQGQYHYFYRGESQKLLQIAASVLPANTDNHYLYGMLAFGLEQCHELSEAEAMARQAIALNRQDPWAHHALAHVMETQGRSAEGIAWMERNADTWENCNTLLYTHNWWHIALFYLKEDPRQALAIYDHHLWGRGCKHSPKDQVGAISLLLRLEMQGVDVGNRWQELGLYLIPRIHEHTLPFQDLHYIYALTRAGQSSLAQKMLQSMETYAKTGSSSLRRLWTGVVLPTARSLVAYARAEWSTAIAELEPVLPHLSMIGGSHAQRDLFRQMYTHARLQNNFHSREDAFKTYKFSH
jgi:hypothetical protein